MRAAPRGNLSNLASRFLFSYHPNFDDFTLLFSRGRLRNVHSFERHVLSYCSVHQIFRFVTSSFPSPSCFAKGSILNLIRNAILQLTNKLVQCYRYFPVSSGTIKVEAILLKTVSLPISSWFDFLNSRHIFGVNITA